MQNQEIKKSKVSIQNSRIIFATSKKKRIQRIEDRVGGHSGNPSEILKESENQKKNQLFRRIVGKITS